MRLDDQNYIVVETKTSLLRPTKLAHSLKIIMVKINIQASLVDTEVVHLKATFEPYCLNNALLDRPHGITSRWPCTSRC